MSDKVYDIINGHRWLIIKPVDWRKVICGKEEVEDENIIE